MSAHTRLVKVKRRADSRAGTEPRSSTEAEHTSPYPRSFEPREEGRESVPYLEVELTTEKQPSQPSRRVHQRTTRVVKTVSRKLGVGTGTETALPDRPLPETALPDSALPETALPETALTESAITTPCGGRAARVADVPTTEPTTPFERTDELDHSTERVAKVIESLTEPNGPTVRPSHLKWLGVVLTQPVVGAALVIGTWLRADFCVTSPVTKIFPRDGGVLVHTHNDSSYFVETSGDTYLVRRAG